MHTKRSFFHVLLALAWIGLTAWGIVSLREPLSFRRPRQLTVDQLVVQHPASGWYTVTGGYLSLAEGIYPVTSQTANGVIKETSDLAEIYFPLRSMDPSAHDGAYAPIRMLVATRDTAVVASFKALPVSLDGKPVQIGIARTRKSGDVTGTIGPHIQSLDGKTQAALRAALPDLDRDYILIIEGSKPSFTKGIVSLALGISLMLLHLYSCLSGRRPAGMG